MTNLALAVGGTGGHIYPAVALANCVREKYSAQARVCIFGAAGGAEERIALREGIDFHPVKVVRLPENKKSPAMAKVPLAIASSVAGASKALKGFDADVVIGFGGYVSFPTVAAARILLGLPVYLHEQNSLMGKSNRLLSRFVKAVFTSFENTQGAPAGKCIFAGNPCRFDGAVPPGAADARAQLGLDPSRKTLFVFGGSQGAVSLNMAAVDFCVKNRADAGLQVLHIAGPKNFETLKKEYAEKLAGAKIAVNILPYCEKMDLAYAASDLVLARAGATTITEIMCVGAAAVLVPFPFAAEGHQEKNARVLADAGAAEMILDAEVKKGAAIEPLSQLLRDDARRARMCEKSKSLFRAGAADNMARVLLGL